MARGLLAQALGYSLTRLRTSDLSSEIFIADDLARRNISQRSQTRTLEGSPTQVERQVEADLRALNHSNNLGDGVLVSFVPSKSSRLEIDPEDLSGGRQDHPQENCRNALGARCNQDRTKRCLADCKVQRFLRPPAL